MAGRSTNRRNNPRNPREVYYTVVSGLNVDKVRKFDGPSAKDDAFGFAKKEADSTGWTAYVHRGPHMGFGATRAKKVKPAQLGVPVAGNPGPLTLLPPGKSGKAKRGLNADQLRAVLAKKKDLAGFFVWYEGKEVYPGLPAKDWLIYNEHLRRGNPGSVSEMSAAEINKALDALDKKDSKFTSDMISAGRGNERFSDWSKMSDPLALHGLGLFRQRMDFRAEMERRYGPGVPSRLPKGFGPIKRNPKDEAAEMFEAFHGEPSNGAEKFFEDEHYHGNLAQLGVLVNFKVKTVAGDKMQINFCVDGADETLCASTANPKTKLDLILDGVIANRREITFDVRDYKEADKKRIIAVAKSRGLDASSDGKHILVRDLRRVKNGIEYDNKKRVYRAFFQSGGDTHYVPGDFKSRKAAQLAAKEVVTAFRKFKGQYGERENGPFKESGKLVGGVVDAVSKPVNDLFETGGKVGGYLDDKLGGVLKGGKRRRKGKRNPYKTLKAKTDFTVTVPYRDARTGQLKQQKTKVKAGSVWETLSERPYVRAVDAGGNYWRLGERKGARWGTKQIEFPVTYEFSQFFDEVPVQMGLKLNPLHAGATLLCANEHGTQLYIIGGDQSLDLFALKLSDPIWAKDSMIIGEVLELTYRTRKSFDNFDTIDYYHKLGEETGERPSLRYDTLNKKLYLDGGQYRIEKPAKGVSPGIEN